VRAMTALLLLLPETPLLFMGQEFASSRPFLYFADHADPRLAEAVGRGRGEFLSQFPSYAQATDHVPNPCDETTFRASVLDFSERATHRADYDLHRDLLKLRREDAVVARQSRNELDGAVLGDRALALRYFGGPLGDRLLLLNLGNDRRLTSCPEPLLAAPAGASWRLVFSTDAPRYGGPGIVAVAREDGWMLPGASAHFFVSSTAPAGDPER